MELAEKREYPIFGSSAANSCGDFALAFCDTLHPTRMTMEGSEDIDGWGGALAMEADVLKNSSVRSVS